MNSDDLVERLRWLGKDTRDDKAAKRCAEAADLIQSLTADNAVLSKVKASTVFQNLVDCVAQGRAIEPNMFAYEGLRDLLNALSQTGGE